MNKIEEAAMRYAESLRECGMYDKETPATKEDMAYAFKAGVNHIMSLPLCDRLTSEEKEKIKGFYNGETFGELDFIELISCRRILENIFGTAMFEEKGDQS